MCFLFKEFTTTAQRLDGERTKLLEKNELAKAKIEDAGVGFVKIIFEPKYREILGVHIVGAMATELIAEFALGKVLETTVDEIGMTIHPHPTLSETVMEAAHAAMGGAIHM